jgi:hypothetical protein
MNGALSVLGATLAVFIAMNWGFSITLLAGGLVYASAAAVIAKASGSPLGQARGDPEPAEGSRGCPPSR